MKHTQGKWYIDGCHISTGIEPTDETICDFRPSTEYPTVNERNANEAMANAKLIVEAPEMFELLNDLFDDMEVWSALSQKQKLRITAVINNVNL